MTAKDRFAASLLGSAVGHAVGSPFAGKKRGSFRAEPGLEGTGREPGPLTGAPALSLCLAETLAEFGLESDSEYIFLRKAGETRRNGRWKPGSPLSRRDRAVRTRGREEDKSLPGAAAHRVPSLIRQSPPLPGNALGSLVWIAPLAYLLKDSRSFQFRLRHVERFSGVESPQPRCILSSVAFVEFLVGLYRALPPAAALAQISVEMAPLADDPRYSRDFGGFGRILDSRVLGAPRNSIRSRETPEETLEAALWCLGHSSGFTDCVMEAVNLGGDTVTTATLAGAAAGVCYGPEAIDPEWLALVEENQGIVSLAHTV